MGYDIYTVNSDMKQSERFARKYGYAYLFKSLDGSKLTIEQLMNRTDVPDNYRFDGDPRVYFRANIWGMADVRSYFTELFNGMPEHTRNELAETYSKFIESISWNEGRHVEPSEILRVLQSIQNFGQDIAQTEMIEEFIEYMEIASTLDGFEVY